MWWRKQVVNRVRTEWTRAGYRVQIGPLAAFCYGHRPPHRRRVFGVIGLVDHHLLFAGQHQPRYDIRIPFDTIRQIEVRPAALVVFHEDGGEWYASKFTTQDADTLAHELSRLIDLPVLPLSTCGPSYALRLFQDVYGDWHPDRADELYLAVDALFFGWQKIMALHQIQRVDVYPQRLRIEYEAEGEFQTVGFDMANPGRWADAIARRVNVPVHRGRKKSPR